MAGRRVLLEAAVYVPSAAVMWVVMDAAVRFAHPLIAALISLAAFWGAVAVMDRLTAPLHTTDPRGALMGLFNRKTASTEPRIPAEEEVAAAGRALARGNSKPADRLCDEAGEHSRAVAMRILGASVDYTPQD